MWWHDNKVSKHVLRSTLLVGVWLAVLLFAARVADQFLEYRPSFPYYDSVLTDFGLPKFLYSFANFDGVHYLTIATRGYHAAELVQAFFPIFPGVLGVLARLGFSPLLGGLVLNWVCVGALVIALRQLLQPYLSREQLSDAVLWLLLFPTSFFFATLYTESVFVLLVVVTFLAAERKRWLLVAVLVALASATRLVGVFLVPALIMQYWLETQQGQWWQIWRTNRSWLPILLISSGALGLISYMLYLQVSFGDPLLFVHVQSQFGAGRETSVILFPQTLWRGLKIVVLVAPGLKWWSYLQDLFFTVLALSALVVGLVQSRELRHKSPLWLRRCCYWLPALPLSWYIFSLAALLLPTATGTLSSMPRYVLVAIPVFAILASAPLPKWGRAVLLIVSSCLLLFNAVLYIQGYWVA